MRAKDNWDIAIDAFVADIHQRAPADFKELSVIDDARRDVLRHAMQRAFAAWAMFHRTLDGDESDQAHV
jgi:hypothetical protein